jgi:putative ABC transport system ATP-binding protein
MSTLIEAVNLKHSFDYELFRDINITLESGSSMAIVGKSGSGKSTLLHILSTFATQDSGNVVIMGRDIKILSNDEIDVVRRYDLGIIFQFHHLFKGMKAIDNINIATSLSNQDIDQSIFEKLEIESNLNQKTSELSGGQQQRISIARVLSKKPRIIFADEPTGNLDKETALLVMNVLLDYVRENDAGLILVTHDEEIAKLCNDVYLLENKSLIKER